jgi:hypothetical protein
MYGEPLAKASGARLREFNVRTLAGYLAEIDVIRRQQKQDQCLFTSNGSGGQFLQSGVWTDQVGSRLGYLFNEGHSFAANDALARMAWVLPKPLDINLILSSTWFTPLTDPPPPPKYTEKQAIAATAIAVCQGAGVQWALTPGHSGTFGRDLQQAKAVGAWFRKVKPYVQNAQPYADVAVVLGTPAAGSPGLPGTNPFWRRPGAGGGAWAAAIAMSDALAERGVCSRMLYRTAQGGSWPDSLAPFRAVLVPETAPLDQAHLDKLRQYVKDGGRLIVFGHGSVLDGKGARRKDYGLADVLGAQFAGQRTFRTHSKEATIEVDSEYNEAFGAHVLASGRGEAWASDGTPMPHWVELTLPAPVDVARVVLVNRAGPYQIADFDIEVWKDKQWKVLKSVRDSSARQATATFAPRSSASRSCASSTRARIANMPTSERSAWWTRKATIGSAARPRGFRWPSSARLCGANSARRRWPGRRGPSPSSRPRPRRLRAFAARWRRRRSWPIARARARRIWSPRETGSFAGTIRSGRAWPDWPRASPRWSSSRRTGVAIGSS